MQPLTGEEALSVYQLFFVVSLVLKDVCYFGHLFVCLFVNGLKLILLHVKSLIQPFFWQKDLGGPITNSLKMTKLTFLVVLLTVANLSSAFFFYRGNSSTLKAS